MSEKSTIGMQNVNEQYIQKGGILGKLSIFTKWLIWLCPKPKPPSDRGHKTYNTGRPFLGHHYFVISLSDLWPRVSRKIFLLCLFVWSLLSHLRIFYSYGDVTIAGEGLQILIHARHSWQLSSEQILTYMYA